MNKLEIDDPLEAFQVHGATGIMGCVVLAFFKIDAGIFYGGQSQLNPDGSKTIMGWELLGVQLFGCLIISLWSGGLSSIFFLVSMRA